MKLRRIEASNLKNESHVDFIEADDTAFASADDFYAEAIRMLWDGFDSAKKTEDYIAEAKRVPIEGHILEEELRWAVQITPIAHPPELESPKEILCMQDNWNLKEFVWRDSGVWRLLSWSTSA